MYFRDLIIGHGTIISQIRYKVHVYFLLLHVRIAVLNVSPIMHAHTNVN